MAAPKQYLSEIFGADGSTVPVKLSDVRSVRANWDDLCWPAGGINPVGLPAPATQDSATGFWEFANGAENVVSLSGIQLPHSWVAGTVIEPHVHWRKKTAGAGDVNWQLTFEVISVNSTFTDAPVPIVAHTVIAGCTDDGTAKKHLITSFGDLTMTGKTVSSCALVILKRLANDADAVDTYTGVAQLISFDIHVKKDSLGSDLQYSKTPT